MYYIYILLENKILTEWCLVRSTLGTTTYNLQRWLRPPRVRLGGCHGNNAWSLVEECVVLCATHNILWCETVLWLVTLWWQSWRLHAVGHVLAIAPEHGAIVSTWPPSSIFCTKYTHVTHSIYTCCTMVQHTICLGTPHNRDGQYIDIIVYCDIESPW